MSELIEVTMVIKGKYTMETLPVEAKTIMAIAVVNDKVACPHIHHQQKFPETFVRFQAEIWGQNATTSKLADWYCNYEKYGVRVPFKEGALLFYSIRREDE